MADPLPPGPIFPRALPVEAFMAILHLHEALELIEKRDTKLAQAHITMAMLSLAVTLGVDPHRIRHQNYMAEAFFELLKETMTCDGPSS